MDINNGFLQLPVWEEPTVTEQQRLANYCHTFCHTHGQEYHHNTNQCRSESVCCQSWKYNDLEEATIRWRGRLHLRQQLKRISIWPGRKSTIWQIGRNNRSYWLDNDTIGVWFDTRYYFIYARTAPRSSLLPTPNSMYNHPTSHWT